MIDGNQWLTRPLYIRNNDFVPRMAQTPRDDAVELATIHTLFKMYFWPSSPLRVRSSQKFYTIEKLDKSKVSRPLI